MAELSTVARPYAKAAFEFAQQTNQIANWSSMLGFAAQLASDAGFAAFLARPTLTTQQQAELFLQATGDALTPEARNFVSYVIANKRLAALPAISSLFEGLKADAEQSADVDVTSAFTLTDAQQAALTQDLMRKLGRQVKLSTQVDASLIGGVVVRSGDLVIDASVRGRLSRLAAALNS